MPILDLATGVTVLGDFVSVTPAYANASAAYDAWALALGVSNTQSLSNFDQDDATTVLDLGFSVLPQSTETRIVVAGESGISLYKAPITNAAYSAISVATHTGVTRMGAVTTPAPTVTLMLRPDTQDAGVGSSKWQKTVDTAILYYRTGPYSNRTALDIAVRLRLGFVEIVTTVNIADTYKFSLAQFQQNMGDRTSDGGVIVSTDLGLVGTTTQFTTASPYSITGVVRDDTGTPTARQILCYLRATGALEKQVTSDAATGAYTLEVYGEGERFVVCLDDSVGTDYNDLIARVFPT